MQHSDTDGILVATRVADCLERILGMGSSKGIISILLGLHVADATQMARTTSSSCPRYRTSKASCSCTRHRASSSAAKST
jgi:hypothetical protein